MEILQEAAGKGDPRHRARHLSSRLSGAEVFPGPINIRWGVCRLEKPNQVSIYALHSCHLAKKANIVDQIYRLGSKTH